MMALSVCGQDELPNGGSHIDGKLMELNKARRKTAGDGCPAGCFARHYYPTGKYREFKNAAQLSFNSFSDASEIEQSLYNAVEAMLVAGFSHRDITTTAIRCHLGLATPKKILYLIDRILDSKHYAILSALVHDP